MIVRFGIFLLAVAAVTLGALHIIQHGINAMTGAL